MAGSAVFAMPILVVFVVTATVQAGCITLSLAVGYFCDAVGETCFDSESTCSLEGAVLNA
jgi:hypothetical protein